MLGMFLSSRGLLFFFSVSRVGVSLVLLVMKVGSLMDRLGEGSDCSSFLSSFLLVMFRMV